MDINFLISNGIDVNKSLEIFGDISMYNETVKTFLDEIDEKINKLRKFKEIGDMTNYAIIVHGLKSEYRYLGYEFMGELCYKHELESKANNLFFVCDDFENLISNIKNSIVIFKKYFGENVVIEKPVVSAVKDKKILIVDDSNMIVNFINKIFMNEYEVIVANDGLKALQCVTKVSNISCMLLDLNMPNVNGFAVLEFFEKNDLFKKIPVSVITGLGNEDLIAQAYKYPIKGVLRKPFNERDLKDVVNKTINCLK